MYVVRVRSVRAAGPVCWIEGCVSCVVFVFGPRLITCLAAIRFPLSRHRDTVQNMHTVVRLVAVMEQQDTSIAIHAFDDAVELALDIASRLRGHRVRPSQKSIGGGHDVSKCFASLCHHLRSVQRRCTSRDGSSSSPLVSPPTCCDRGSQTSAPTFAAAAAAPVSTELADTDAHTSRGHHCDRATIAGGRGPLISAPALATSASTTTVPLCTSLDVGDAERVSLALRSALSFAAGIVRSVSSIPFSSPSSAARLCALATELLSRLPTRIKGALSVETPDVWSAAGAALLSLSLADALTPAQTLRAASAVLTVLGQPQQPSHALHVQSNSADAGSVREVDTDHGAAALLDALLLRTPFLPARSDTMDLDSLLAPLFADVSVNLPLAFIPFVDHALTFSITLAGRTKHSCNDRQPRIEDHVVSTGAEAVEVVTSNCSQVPSCCVRTA